MKVTVIARPLVLALNLAGTAVAFTGTAATTHSNVLTSRYVKRAAREERLANNAAYRHGDARQGRFGILPWTRGGQIRSRTAVAAPVEVADAEERLVEPSLAAQEPEKKGPLNAYLRLLDRRPLPTKIITSGLICGIGDILAQVLANPDMLNPGVFAKALQPQRVVIYGVLGALWVAPVVHYWFDALENVFKGKSGPPKTFAGRMSKAFKMVTLDQIIGAPFTNAGFMFLFTFATALTSGTAAVPAGRKAGTMMRNNLWGTMLVCWKLWPVANFINFAFVPPKLRVLFMNFVGLGWNIFLSGAVN